MEEGGTMDISPIFLNPQLSRAVTEAFVNNARRLQVDAVCGIECRGGYLGPVIAQQLDLPFILIRNQGKLSGDTVSYSYKKEGGRTSAIELRIDDIKKGSRVLIHDDTLTSGQTIEAASELLIKRNCKVTGYSFIAHLAHLGGAERLIKYSRNLFALAVYGAKKNR